MAARATGPTRTRGRDVRVLRGADRTPFLRRPRRRACAPHAGAVSAARANGRFPRVNAFHVLGGLLALWALVLSALGITRENFPGSKAAERVVALISVVLVALAIGSAVITAANERAESEEHEGEEHSALAVPV